MDSKESLKELPIKYSVDPNSTYPTGSVSAENDGHKEITVGLALSGGSALGAAHVGVLYALEEEGVHPDMIAGTSAGAIIGALYAFGVPVAEIEEHVRNTSWHKIGYFTPSLLGLLSNSKLGDGFRTVLGDVRMEEATIPFGATAVDIGTGERLLLRTGKLADAVRASASIPGVFQPVEWDGRLLVDGGLVEHLPVASAREMGADRVIGVDLRSREPNPTPKNVIEIFTNFSWIVTHNYVHLASSEMQTIITPDLTAFSPVDTRTVTDLIWQGYIATRAVIDDIHRLVKGE